MNDTIIARTRKLRTASEPKSDHGPNIALRHTGTGARFALLVHHDDAEREWAYDRDAQFGELDKAWDESKAKGWTIVSMKDDWKTIFPK